MLRDGLLEVRRVSDRDVGRVRDGEREGAGGPERREPVRGEETDPRCDPVPHRVLACEGERPGRPVEGHDRGAGPLEGERHGEDTASRAEVEDPAGRRAPRDRRPPRSLPSRRAGSAREGRRGRSGRGTPTRREGTGAARRLRAGRRARGRRPRRPPRPSRRGGRGTRPRGRPVARASSSSASKAGCSGEERRRRASARSAPHVGNVPSSGLVPEPFVTRFSFRGRAPGWLRWRTCPPAAF